MNVMLLIGTLSNGGAEHSIVNLANELSKYHNVTLVATNKKCDYDCKVKTIILKKRNIVLGLDMIYKLRKLKKQLNIDVTISYITTFNYFNALSKYKDKVIISVRNYLSVKKEGFKADIMYKLATIFSDKIVCCSDAVMYDQITNYKIKKEKLVMIPNFCNEEEIKNTIKNEEYEKRFINDNTIVSMGRLVFHKGHQFIIEAMKLVVEEIPSARLLIFGRGPYESELNNLIKKYNLENNVYLMGFNSKPNAYINKSKAFILASLYEGFPNVVIEAMTSGTPIIATNSPGGNYEILTDKNIKVDKVTLAEYGILVPNFDKNIDENILYLKDAIIKLLTDDKLNNKYRKKSLERVKKYSKDKVVKKWLEVIK